MASNLNPLPPIPPATQPVIEGNGRMNRDWYLYFQRLDQHLREAEQRLTTGGL